MKVQLKAKLRHTTYEEEQHHEVFHEKPILYQPSLTMHILPLLAYITSYAAAAAVDVSTAIKSNDYDDEYPNEQIKVEHWGDSVVTAVTAWNVMVVVSL